jgi:hypothetical protein
MILELGCGCIGRCLGVRAYMGARTRPSIYGAQKAFAYSLPGHFLGESIWHRIFDVIQNLIKFLKHTALSSEKVAVHFVCLHCPFICVFLASPLFRNPLLGVISSELHIDSCTTPRLAFLYRKIDFQHRIVDFELSS